MYKLRENENGKTLVIEDENRETLLFKESHKNGTRIHVNDNGRITVENLLDGDVQTFISANITTIIAIISAAIGIATTTIKAIQLWIDDRKSRRIRIKYKDIEVEISGPVSKEEIFKKIEIFTAFKEKIEKEDVEIILIDGKEPNQPLAR